MPYDFSSSDELLLTAMVDYYCALRIVSCTLHAGQRFLWRQKNPPIIFPPIGSGELQDLFSAAVTLRHKALFEDCLIIGAGKLNDPLYRYIEDEKVREQAKDMHIAVLNNVTVNQYFLLQRLNRAVKEGGWSRGLIDEMKAAINEAAVYSITNSPEGERDQVELAQYYRFIYEWESSEGHREFDSALLQSLMWNELTLDKTAKSGVGEFEDIFLRGHFPVGASVPWDTEDMDF
jgi:hypothetical protein